MWEKNEIYVLTVVESCDEKFMSIGILLSCPILRSILTIPNYFSLNKKNHRIDSHCMTVFLHLGKLMKNIRGVIIVIISVTI